MKKGKRFLAFMLAAMLAVGSLQMPTIAGEYVSTEETVEASDGSEEYYNADAQDSADGTDTQEKEAAAIPEGIGDAITSYTVTLNANGGYFEDEWDDVLGEAVESTEVISKIIPVGGAVTTLPVMEQESAAATFLGWSLERDGDLISQEREEYAPAGDCVLYAVWEYKEIFSNVDPVVNADDIAGDGLDDDSELTEDYGDAADSVDMVAETDNDSGNNPSDSSFDESDPEGSSSESVAFNVADDESPEDGSSDNADSISDTSKFDETSDQEAVEDDASRIKDGEQLEDDYQAIDHQNLLPFDESKNADESIEGMENVSTDAAMGVQASGTCGINGDNLTWTLDFEGTLTITGSGDMGNYNPLFILTGENPVPWYENKDAVKSLRIENDVTSIGDSAFIGCSNLINIMIPDTLISIGGYAFSSCNSMSNITIPDSVKSIGYATFSGCSSLNTITIPDSVTSIGDGAFSGCSSLSMITIPGSVANIGYATFFNCSSLNTITIPDSVTSIGASAFDNCVNLTIRGNAGSYAEEYANAEDIPFEYVTENSIKDSLIEGISDKTYTGKAITQTLTVTLCSTRLTANTDYTLSYKNNTNVGTATITITGKGKYKDSISRTFKINKATQSITASNLSLTYLKTGTITSVGNKGKLTYKSSNTAVATVDSAGKVTAKGAGTTKITITAAATSNYKAATKQITITVAKAAQSITAKAYAPSIAVGKMTTVSLTGNKGTESFKSSDTTIAIVTSAGKVTAKKVGKVTITATSAATANYKAASKTVTIKVVPAATSSFTAENQATGIKLTWKKVTDANAYFIYRGSSQIAAIRDSSTVTYTDKKANTNGTKYTYEIIASASSTGRSTLSKSVTTYCVARPAISTLANSAASKMTVKWEKNAKATGYQIQYCPDKTFKTGNKSVSINSASTVSKVIGSLEKGKTYYVRIRTFKTVGSTKYFSAWSAVKSVKITK